MHSRCFEGNNRHKGGWIQWLFHVHSWETPSFEISWTYSKYIYIYIYIAGSHGRTKHPVVTRCHLCLYTLPNFSWRSKRWDIVGPYWTDVELIQLYSYISYTCGWTDGGANSVLGYDLQGPHNNIEAWTADLERWGAENAAPFRSS